MQIQLTGHIHIVCTTAKSGYQTLGSTLADKCNQGFRIKPLCHAVHQQAAADRGQIKDNQGNIVMIELLLCLIRVPADNKTQPLMVTLLAELENSVDGVGAV